MRGPARSMPPGRGLGREARWLQPGCMASPEGNPVMTGAHLVRDDHVEALSVVGGRLELLTSPAATGDVPCILRGTIPPGGFVPLHSHPDPETFIGVSGVLEGLTGPGDVWSPIAPGDVFHVPGGIAHAFRNRGDEPATSLAVTTSTLARFFREVAGMSDLREAAGRYGHWLASPAENAEIGLVLPIDDET